MQITIREPGSAITHFIGIKSVKRIRDASLEQLIQVVGQSKASIVHKALTAKDENVTD